MMKNEKTEFLFNNISIFQSEDYKFSADSINLAKFVKLKNDDSVLELCAGCGVIGFCLLDLHQFKDIQFVDILASMCEVIDKNIKHNNIKNARVLCGNLKDLSPETFDKKFDVIVFNPPYYKQNAHHQKDTVKNIAYAENTAKFEDIIAVSKKLTKSNGNIYFSFLSERLAEAIVVLHKYGFAVKNIKFNLINNKSKVILIHARYGGKFGVKLEF